MYYANVNQFLQNFRKGAAWNKQYGVSSGRKIQSSCCLIFNVRITEKHFKGYVGKISLHNREPVHSWFPMVTDISKSVLFTSLFD